MEKYDKNFNKKQLQKYIAENYIDEEIQENLFSNDQDDEILSDQCDDKTEEVNHAIKNKTNNDTNITQKDYTKMPNYNEMKEVITKWVKHWKKDDVNYANMNRSCCILPNIDLLPSNLKFETKPKFSEVLLEYIDKKNMTDAECYKKAGVDRRLFSKIRSNKDYSPAKNTVFAFIIALKLNMHEAEDLMMSAGYCISNSHLKDVIISFCIKNAIYNIYDINSLLAQYGAETID